MQSECEWCAPPLRARWVICTVTAVAGASHTIVVAEFPINSRIGIHVTGKKACVQTIGTVMGRFVTVDVTSRNRAFKGAYTHTQGYTSMTEMYKQSIIHRNNIYRMPV